MIVRQAEVLWNDHCANVPRLLVLVDEVPRRDELRYEKREFENGRTLYVGKNDGYASYYAYNPEDESGYSGRRFTFELVDGTTEQVTGPWSSRAGVVNRHGLGPVVDVALTDSPEFFETQGTFQSGAVTLRAAKRAIDLDDEASHLERRLRFSNDEPYWIPVRDNGGGV